MALIINKDYVFVPVVDIFQEKGCFVGTKEYLYIVPDEKTVLEKNLKEFLVNGLRKTELVERFNFGDHTPREMVAEVLSDAELTLDNLDLFFSNFKEKWNAVERVEIDELQNLKVGSTWFGGSISVRYKGEFGYSALITSIPGSHKKIVKEFYLDVMQKVKAR
jgi:hypothetical protein